VRADSVVTSSFSSGACALCCADALELGNCDNDGLGGSELSDCGRIADTLGASGVLKLVGGCFCTGVTSEAAFTCGDGVDSDGIGGSTGFEVSVDTIRGILRALEERGGETIRLALGSGQNLEFIGRDGLQQLRVRRRRESNEITRQRETALFLLRVAVVEDGNNDGLLREKEGNGGEDGHLRGGALQRLAGSGGGALWRGEGVCGFDWLC